MTMQPIDARRPSSLNLPSRNQMVEAAPAKPLAKSYVPGDTMDIFIESKIQKPKAGHLQGQMADAIVLQRHSTVLSLIKSGADLKDGSLHGVPLLNLAFSNGTPEIVRAMVGAGADINNIDRFENTVLIYLVRNNDIEGVRLFIELGGDVSAILKYGHSPFTIADKNKNQPIKDLLLGAGIDPELRSPNFF